MFSKFSSLSSKTKGVIFIILSALSFTGMNTFVRLAGDLPTMQKVFFRNFVAMIFAFAAMVKAGDSFKPKKGSLKYLLIRSAAGLAGIFGNFYALDKIELSNASMLNKMSPFFALVFSAIFIKEKVKPKQAVAIAVAFIGATKNRRIQIMQVVQRQQIRIKERQAQSQLMRLM